MAAGNPTYRQLAQRAHYSAAALARAASGAALPTLDLTLAYVAACDGDPDVWRTRWQTAAEHVGTTRNEPIPAPVPRAATGTAGSSRSGYRWLLIGLGVTLAIVIAIVVAFASRPSRPALRGAVISAPSWSPAAHVLPLPSGPDQPRSDGTDPARNGCAQANATDLDHVDIWLDHVLLGQLELRYSPACKATWARMDPTGALINNPSQGIRIRLQTLRPADSTASRIDDTFVRDRHWAGMLSTTTNCVTASGTILIGNQQSLPVHTQCLTTTTTSSGS